MAYLFLYIISIQQKETRLTDFECGNLIKKDKNHPEVILELSIQIMTFDIADLINRGVITTVDLVGFSDE